jgi:hypothetical protein
MKPSIGDTSEQIYGMSLGPHVGSQAKIVDEVTLPHPAQTLLAPLREVEFKVKIIP